MNIVQVLSAADTLSRSTKLVEARFARLAGSKQSPDFDTIVEELGAAIEISAQCRINYEEKVRLYRAGEVAEATERKSHGLDILAACAAGCVVSFGATLYFLGGF